MKNNKYTLPTAEMIKFTGNDVITVSDTVSTTPPKDEGIVLPDDDWG